MLSPLPPVFMSSIVEFCSKPTFLFLTIVEIFKRFSHMAWAYAHSQGCPSLSTVVIMLTQTLEQFLFSSTLSDGLWTLFTIYKILHFVWKLTYMNSEQDIFIVNKLHIFVTALCFKISCLDSANNYCCYFIVLFWGRLSCLFKDSRRTPKQYFEKCYNV